MSTNLVDYLARRGSETARLADLLRDKGLEGTWLKYLSDASDLVLDTFFADLARCRIDWIQQHRKALSTFKGSCAIEDPLEPVVPGTLTPGDTPDAVAGKNSLMSGEWASVIFSGGAATRFFAEAANHPDLKGMRAGGRPPPPKGLFPVTPVAGRTFLERFFAQALWTGIVARRMPCMVLMTSPMTDGPLRAWLSQSRLWGFPKDVVHFVMQAENPRIDGDGDLIATPDGHLMFSGDGHGGIFRALMQPQQDGASLLVRLADRGIRHLILHNVDNAAANAFDPARLGFHARRQHAMTLTVVPRRHVREKVGLVVHNRRTDRVDVVEYSVCPRSLAEATDPATGQPLFHLAHINTNLVAVSAVRADLPPTLYTDKKVLVGDRFVASSTFEMLNQHLTRLIEPARVGVLLADRDAFFLPTKSVSGEDSLETTMAALGAQGRDMLQGLGATVAPSARIECDPCLGNRVQDWSSAGIGADWVVGDEARLLCGVRHGIDGCPPHQSGFRMDPGSSFLVQAESPYGNVAFDKATRAIQEDAASAGRLRVGRDVVIAAGTRVEVTLEGNATLTIPDHTLVSGTIMKRVASGEHARIE